MITLVFARRYLLDYVRNPVNLMLLAVVPVVFVVVVAGTMADAAKLLGGVGGPAVETATAGWAAAFLTAIGMYFQTAAARETDRRLVITGLPAWRLVLARLETGAALAVLASAAALVALAVRVGIDNPLRAVAGTAMFAVIYLGIGTVVGALVRNPVNGMVVVLFVWIVDVFFGPTMGAADRPVTRALPTHFVTLWMVDLPSRHGGELGDLGWALVWTGVAALTAWAVAAARTRAYRPPRPARPGSQLTAASRAAWRDARRNPAMWALFVVVPVVFILLADAVTPDKPIVLRLVEDGHRVARSFSMIDVHGATMAPIAVAALAALAGLFAVLDSAAGDRRAALAGMRPRALFSGRTTMLVGAAVLATAVSMATTALVFDARSWPLYVAANLLLAVTYGMVGALLAPIFGKVGGVFLVFLVPFLDIGITQSPMLHQEPSTVGKLLPGYGGSRLLLDGALTDQFDESRPLMIGLIWLVALYAAVAVVYRRATAPSR
jgi:hypothetical protein